MASDCRLRRRRIGRLRMVMPKRYRWRGFFVNLYLWRLRRFPGQTSAPNKICPNLWLDTNHLSIPHSRSIYIAHEILQAKPLFDKSSVSISFLKSNSWVQKYLPVAYKNLTLGPSPKFRRGKPQQGEVFWKFINSIFFIIQYLYMKPKMTSERVSLHSAFFHPQK